MWLRREAKRCQFRALAFVPQGVHAQTSVGSSAALSGLYARLGTEELQDVLGGAMNTPLNYDELVVGNALQMMTDAELEEFARLLSELCAVTVKEQVARQRELLPRGDEIVH